MFAGSEPLGTGHGATKQEAEQEAAKAALQSLGGGTASPVSTIKPARAARPRQRRQSRARSAPAGDGAASEAATLVVVPEPDPVPEPGRSRQFGEPLE